MSGTWWDPTWCPEQTGEEGSRCPRRLKKRLKRDALETWGKPFPKRLKWAGWETGVEVRTRAEWHEVYDIDVCDRYSVKSWRWFT